MSANEAYPPSAFSDGVLPCDLARDRDWSDCWLRPADPRVNPGRKRRGARAEAHLRGRAKDTLPRRHFAKCDPEYVAELSRVMRYLLNEGRPGRYRSDLLPDPFAALRTISRRRACAHPLLISLDETRRAALRALQRPLVALPMATVLIACAAGLMLL